MKTHKTLETLYTIATASAVVVVAITLPIWIWATVKIALDIVRNY